LFYEEEALMYCHACGKQIGATASFCNYCGAATKKTDAPSPLPPPAPSHPLPPGNRPGANMPLLIALGVAGLLFLCVVGWVILDPFHLIGRFTGRYDAALTAMPPDTRVYVGVNLLAVDQKQLNKIVDAFERSAAGTYQEELFRDRQEVLDDIWRELDREFGINFETDIVPWLGQYAGVGMLRMDLGRFGEPTNLQWIAAVESRNGRAADAFVDKFVVGFEDANRVRFNQSEYKKVTIHEVDNRYAWDRMAIARSGNLVLVADSARSLEKAIDAQQGSSLAGSSVYQTLRAKLPRKRAITAYLDLQMVDDLNSSLRRETGINVPTASTTGYEGMAFSLSLVDAGLQMDFATAYELNQLSPAQAALIRYKPDRRHMDTILPESTLAYLVLQPPDLMWAAFKEAMQNSVGVVDFDEAMLLFRNEFGFDPDRDLFPLLKGNWALAVVPSSTGFLADQAELPIGVIAMFQTADERKTHDLARNVSRDLEYHGYYISNTSFGNSNLYTVQDYWGNDTVTYGAGNGYLYIGSSSRDINEMNGRGGKLSANTQYKQVWRHFPRGMTPVFYLNVGETLNSIRRNLSGYQAG
jgi:hypothetical protein